MINTSPSDNNPPYDDEEEISISKSAIKREMAALQKTGEALLDLPLKQFAKVPISNQLREALELARILKNREGKRRQMQYVGKLMRGENHQGITEALSSFDEESRTFRLQFQRLEKLRDELLEDTGDRLTEILKEHPQLEAQHLRQLIRLARKEHEQNKGPAASRKLFKYLRESLLS